MRGLLDGNHCTTTFLIIFLPVFNKDQRNFPITSAMAENWTRLFGGTGYLGETKIKSTSSSHIAKNRVGELAEHIVITR